MHTIFGAGGSVANVLTRQLENNNETVKLVSRKPIQSARKNITWQKADLLNFSEVLAAAKGSGVIYLTAGLVYDHRVWAQQWPVIIQNMINASKETGARLIFFDNVYMYGLVNGPMLETTPYNPVSKKGEIRAKIATTLMDEAKAGNIRASIARGADFYGAENGNSFFDMMVLSKYANNERRIWLGNPDKKHTFTYVPDAGLGMYLLGKTPESDNQIWHMPSAAPLTGREFIEIAAKTFNAAPKFMSLPKFMVWAMGLFNKTIMGTVEMFYQYDHDYIFNSDKFEKAFNIKPTSYENGIKELSQTLYKK